jgi:sugar (pentulose or hexulose) kinase
MDYCIAVFDVGKTNKKLLIFDPKLQIVDSAYRSFPELEEKGIRYENTGEINSWFMDQLKRFADEYPVRIISVAAHGATFAAVDDLGELVLPVISYTTDVDGAFHTEFYNAFGNSSDLQRVTATPHMDALVNVAKGIYFARKNFPSEFRRTVNILNYPQYFGALLTGNFGAESTYVGCHTYLWDFREKTWSSVARDMGIVDLLPKKVGRPWDILGRVKPGVARETGLSPDTLVTMGIHDSNASLLPYLIGTEEEFVLNSTGTWCVIMHPTDKVIFSKEDIGKVVFYNLDAFFRPVKTAIFTGGVEFDTYTELFRKHTGEEPDTGFDRKIYKRLLEERRLFILPTVFRGTGQFPDSPPRAVEDGAVFPLEDIRTDKRIPGFFKDSKISLAVLELSLAIQTKVALERAGFQPPMSLFVEGGFRKNKSYVALLTALFPDSGLYLTSMKEATAFGAAILGKVAVERLEPRDVKDLLNIDFKPVPPVHLEYLEDYMEVFLHLVQKEKEKK